MPSALLSHGRLLAVASLLTIAGASAADLPGVAGTDGRQPIDIAAEPWRSVAKVQSGGGPRCTGVLVAPGTVLTAAHCLWNRRTRRLLPPSSLHVLFGYDTGSYQVHATVVAFEVAPGWTAPSTEPVTLARDWAVLRLEGNGAAGVPPLQLAAEPPVAGTPLSFGGFNQDRVHRLIADTDCRLTGIAAVGDGGRLLRHDCAGTRGTSGGPLLTRGPAGWEVVGLSVAVGPTGSLAVPAAAVRALTPR